jgi:hypothetical protein
MNVNQHIAPSARLAMEKILTPYTYRIGARAVERGRGGS